MQAGDTKALKCNTCETLSMITVAEKGKRRTLAEGLTPYCPWCGSSQVTPGQTDADKAAKEGYRTAWGVVPSEPER